MNSSNIQITNSGGNYPDLEMPSIQIRFASSLRLAQEEERKRSPQLSIEDANKFDAILAAQKAFETFDPAKVWFTRAEAAKYLSVSAKTIDRCRIKQDLPYYQLEGRATIRFKRKDLDKLMR